MLEQRFGNIWRQLQGKKPHFQHFLSGVEISGLRGINGLRVAFDYPVSVIAGGNATGKSTVLFAAACAYKVPGAGVKDFVPSTLFPYYRPKVGNREDDKGEITIEFDYITPTGRLPMQWHRGKGWNRNFLGRKNVSQPRRDVYLRTLSNLSNPAEVRGVLGMAQSASAPTENRMTASQIEFAQRMLPFRYEEVVALTSGKKSLLFAEQNGGAAYSELHMSAGERSILRLSQEIAQLNGALILIDEVEAGLHPWVQQLLMLQLQQTALRNDLQIIVTSHSPVVLDCVPDNGRIFLDRDDTGKVIVRPAYHDVVQNALYGRSSNALNILCEDNIAEGVLRGVFDVLYPKREIRTDMVRIGRDTGANEFPSHARAFRKFGQIRNFVFVLDGDKRDSDVADKIQAGAGTSSDTPILFLPGRNVPEAWIWERLGQNREIISRELGITQSEFSERINRTNAVYDSASDRPSEIVKHKLNALANALNQDAPDICRVVARIETNRSDSDIQPLVEGLEIALLNWRGG